MLGLLVLSHSHVKQGELIAGGREVRIEGHGLLKRGDRPGVIRQFLLRQRQIIVGLRIPRIKLQRLLVTGNCRLGVALDQGLIGTARGRARNVSQLILLLALFELAQFLLRPLVLIQPAQYVRKLELRLLRIRLKTAGLLEVLPGFLQFAETGEHKPEIVLRRVVAGG